MKYALPAVFGFLFAMGLLFPSDGLHGAEISHEARLRNVDAVQAMRIANDWKWSEEEVTSYVTPREVVFELPTGEVKSVALPDDRMVVAVAPYVVQTHE